MAGLMQVLVLALVLVTGLTQKDTVLANMLTVLGFPDKPTSQNVPVQPQNSYFFWGTTVLSSLAYIGPCSYLETSIIDRATWPFSDT
ncbi:hypothetical protein N9L68_08420 [bacterium]|nr:hypothetical protein [bacterium]